MFCSQTGVYLPAPQKKRKEVSTIRLPRRGGDFLHLNQNGKVFFANLVKVVLHDERLLVVETTNSVYVGKPA